MTLLAAAAMQIPKQHRRQDHRRIKRLVRPGLGFAGLPTARVTLAGYEAMAMIRKGQAHTIGGRDMQAQAAFVAGLFQVAARNYCHQPLGTARCSNCNRTYPGTWLL